MDKTLRNRSAVVLTAHGVMQRGAVGADTNRSTTLQSREILLPSEGLASFVDKVFKTNLLNAPPWERPSEHPTNVKG